MRGADIGVSSSSQATSCREAPPQVAYRTMLAAPDDPRGTRNETTVLFLAANPVEMPLLQLGDECRAIEDKIRAARFRDKLRFRSRWAARPDDLLQAIHEDDPAVLHFSGHGAGAQGLCFLAEDGGVLCVNSDGLGQVIRAAGDSIQLVVLNACYTKVQAQALVAHVPCVIGMPSAIGDRSAIVYAAELYRALAFGKSVASAHQCGLAALALPMTGNMRDVDVAEAVLRTAPPELLVRTGVDAGHVHIVQGTLHTSAVPASSGECRIHLEIDIDGDFETLDANTLGKLVSEIYQLSGGRPVRILCVTKGSIRLHLSFEPDAARALMSLRESGRLNRISGFRVSNVVNLGHVEISAQAREHADVPQQPSDPAIEAMRIRLRRSRPSDMTEDEFEDALRQYASDLEAAADRLQIPGPSIHELIERSLRMRTAGDVSGKATTLYAALEDALPLLTRIAHRLYGNTPDADDLVQETIERGIRHGLPADVQHPRAWLATMMHNLFVDRCRAPRAPVLEEVHEEVHEDVARVLDSLEEFHDDVTLNRWLRVLGLAV
ncbi:MAG: CHAT domain-containing protein [Deltaproteobacteria bacterium]|nr:MAG: CHAT domain-containing protein [Deltaproteobacteria bacterium]